MQPENNLNAQALEPTQEFAPVESQPTQEPQPAELPVEKAEKSPEKPKKNLVGMIFGIFAVVFLIVCVVLGIVLGLNNQNGSETASGAHENPVIKDETGAEVWSEYYESSRVYVNGTKTVGLIVKNGEVESCEIQGTVEVTTEDGKGTIIEGETTACVVSGLMQDVYKVVEFGEGTSPDDLNLGFIMTDGTMYYVKTVEAIENNNFSVKPVKVEGRVVDTIKIDIEPTEENPSGTLSSVLVLQDGSLVKFENSMLE